VDFVQEGSGGGCASWAGSNDGEGGDRMRGLALLLVSWARVCAAHFADVAVAVGDVG
jgi:hypothetical protein